MLWPDRLFAAEGLIGGFPEIFAMLFELHFGSVAGGVPSESPSCDSEHVNDTRGWYSLVLD
jgi:hypothetical protein